MALDLDKLLQDLKSTDEDILSLAITTAGRLPLKGSGYPRKLQMDLLFLLEQLSAGTNADLAFLARKSLEHVRNELPQLTENKASEEKQEFCSQNLFHKDPAIRLQSLSQLQIEKIEGAYDLILDAMAKENDDKNLAAQILALSTLGNPRTVILLQVFLFYEDDRIRANAVEAIELLGRKEDILEMLPPLINDKSNRVRANVLKAIGKFRIEEMIAHLQSMITSPEIATRASALYALSHLKGEPVVRMLNIAASDPYEGIRLKTVDVLKNLPDKNVIPILKRLSQDLDVEISEKALKAIEQFSVDNQISLFDLTQIETKPETSTPEAPDPTPAATAEDLAEVDEKMDAEMLKIGQNLHIMIQKGLVKDDRFSKHLYNIERNQEMLASRKSKNSDQKFLSSLKRVLGASYDEDIAIQELETRLEDSIIELGYEAFEINVNEGTVFPGLTDRFKSALHFYEQRRKLEYGALDSED